MAVSVRVARAIGSRFREGQAALNTDAWRTWQRSVLIGAAAMFVLMIALRVVAERVVESGALENGALSSEGVFLLRLGEKVSLNTAIFLQTFGSDITLIVLVTLTAGIAAWTRRPIIASSIVLAAVVPDLVVRFGWSIWARARPDLLYDGLAAPGFHSFPSGHAAKTMAVYGLLGLIWARASDSGVERACALIVPVCIVTAVGLGRMAMGAHWPSDIVGGVIIGAVWAVILDRAARAAHGVR